MIYSRNNRMCARCRCSLTDTMTTGDSGIYQSHGIELCEPCFFEEDAEIEREGTNNLPDTLKRYRENVRFGAQ